MKKDFNQTKSVYNQCFRNSSAYDSNGKLRDSAVTWSWFTDNANPVLVVHQTPTPNTRELLIGISVDAAAIISIRKYFSAGASFVTETFAALPAAGTYTLRSTTLLDTVELYAIPDSDDLPAAPDLHVFATIIARP